MRLKAQILEPFNQHTGHDTGLGIDQNPLERQVHPGRFDALHIRQPTLDRGDAILAMDRRQG